MAASRPAPSFPRTRELEAPRVLLLMYPLHFGRFGGRWGSPTLYYGVMVFYVIVGVTPFVLMATGLLMYWNRSFSKKWRRARLKQYAPSAALAGGPVTDRQPSRVR